MQVRRERQHGQLPYQMSSGTIDVWSDLRAEGDGVDRCVIRLVRKLPWESVEAP